jgi:hypothetical protein
MKDDVAFDEFTANSAASRPLGAISTLVSLFLLLLVFFIVLFSIAQVHRRRVDEVVSSIDRAFGGLPSRVGILPPPVVPPAGDDAAASFVRDASLLLTGFPPAEDSEAAPAGGDLLEIAIPAERLFQPDSAQLSRFAAGLAAPLAVLLQRRSSPLAHYRLTVRTAAPDKAAGGLAIAREAAFAAALFSAGCPQDRLAIGVDAAAGAGFRFDFAEIASPDQG